jgi:hypothetical protein
METLLIITELTLTKCQKGVKYIRPSTVTDNILTQVTISAVANEIFQVQMVYYIRTRYCAFGLFQWSIINYV